MFSTNPLLLFLAASPLLIVLYLMLFRRWGGSQAGPVGWLAAILVAWLAFGANDLLLLVAWGRSVLLALFVLYIIWMALLLYHVLNEAGVITVIGQELPGLAPDRSGQALLLAWVFGSFLQGASGFGVPAAVVAPLLVSTGFAANTAVVIALLGHAWAVTFGSLGSSFIALVAATGMPGEVLAGPAALLLGICCLLCGLVVLWLADGWCAVRQRLGQLLVLSIIMAGVQYGLAVAGLWTMAAFGAGLVGMLVAIFDFRRGLSRRGQHGAPPAARAALDVPRLMRAVWPYLLLVVIIVLGELVFNEPLNRVELNLAFPQVSTALGWVTPGGPGRSISLFGHAGALLLYTSLLAFGWYRWQGTLLPGGRYSGRRIFHLTLRGAVKSTISILTLLAMAVTMQHAGMTNLLAQALSNTASFFPFLSPFIGVLGSLMTGSNTNSNVVFGQLQQQTALSLQLSAALILAGQTAGGALGSSFAPAKVVVGCSTVQGANDNQVLKVATLYGVGMTLLIACLVWLLSYII